MPEGGRPVLVKICGVTRPEDARAVADAGAAYLGVILSRGFARSIEPERAGALLDGAGDGGPALVAVVVDEGVAGATELARRAGADVVQLHGSESAAELRALREEGPWRLWKALRVRSAGQVEDALERYGEVADALLLEGDHGGRGGGAGARFPWDAVATLRDRFPAGLDLVVAGGLDPGNVRDAIETLRPDVVDTSSGVEVTPGVKDAAAVVAFVRAVGVGRAVAVPEDDPSGLPGTRR